MTDVFDFFLHLLSKKKKFPVKIILLLRVLEINHDAAWSLLSGANQILAK